MGDLPKIDPAKSAGLERDLNEVELFLALRSCSDSAPGPDGIPYSVYKMFWSKLGPELLKCWNYSISVGKLSPDQRYSVINLIPKPGKDTSIIKNLRPISLTNCDVKIYTKALTQRFATIMPDIIGEFQTAYVKGRQVTDNTFMIDKIIKLAEKLQSDLFIISLDAKKAFDSVDHEYMYSVMRGFGCGEKIILAVKALYCDLTSSVLVNGFKTEVFKILRGVKQGDALSCILFVMCMEPLIRKIQNSDNVSTIDITSPIDGSKCVPKVSAYADDLGGIVINVESIREIFKIYEVFSRHSGIFINADKTEILKIGPHSINPPSNIDITYCDSDYTITTTNSIKICGVVHPIDNDDSYVKNITEKIDKMKVLLRTWRPRQLTLKGKILIVKTFAISQIVYQMHTCDIKDKDLTTIERLCYAFIWNSKEGAPNDKVKRSLLKNTYEEGGLKGPCIYTINESLKIKKHLRCQNNHLAPITDKIMSLYGIYSRVNHSFSRASIKLITCPNTNRTIVALGKINAKTVEIILQKNIDEIDQEDIDYLSKHDLLSSQHLKNNASNNAAVRRMAVRNVKTLGDLVKITFNNNELIFRMAKSCLIKSFPHQILNILNAKSDLIKADGPKDRFLMSDGTWVKMKDLDSQKFKITIGKDRITNMTNDMVAMKYGITETIAWNCFDNFPTGETYLLSQNYRFLTGSYCTRVKLKMYKIIDSDLCPFCEEEVDDLKHAILQCPLSNITWGNLQKVINNLGINYTLTTKDVVYGVGSDCSNRNVINTLLIQIKFRLASPIAETRIMEQADIYKMLSDKLHIESLVDARRQSRKIKSKIATRWKNIINKIRNPIII